MLRTLALPTITMPVSCSAEMARQILHEEAQAAATCPLMYA